MNTSYLQNRWCFRPEMNTKTYDYVFKCVIIGDTRVGKTTLLRRYMGEGCSTDTCQDHEKHSFVHINRILSSGHVSKELEKSNAVVNLQIHDTMGQERFRSLTRSYYRGAHGCLVCFDVNNPASFDNLNTWLHDVQECLTSDVTCVVKLLVGIVRPIRTESRDTCVYHTTLYNRSDSSTSVPRLRAEDFADKHDMRYLEVNLNDTCHVEDCFHKLVESMINARRKYGKRDINDSIKLRDNYNDGSKTKSNWCSC